MKFLIDENAVYLTSWLSELGFWWETLPFGTSDEDVFSVAKRKGLILLTHDKDFLRDRYSAKGTAGVFVIRTDEITKSPTVSKDVLVNIIRFIELTPVQDKTFSVKSWIDPFPAIRECSRKK